MKRFRAGCILAALFIICTGLTVCAYLNYQEAQQYSTLGMANSSFQIQVRNSQKSMAEMASEFDALSHRYHVSIVRTYSDYLDGTQRFVYSGVYCWDTFPTEQLNVVTGTLPSDREQFLSTTASEDPHQSGRIRDFAADCPVLVQWFSHDDALESPNGIYTISSKTQFDGEALVDELSSFLGESRDDLTDVRTSFVLGRGLLPLVAMTAFVLILCFVLTMVASILSNSQTIGIQSMLGWSKWDIWLNHVRGVFPYGAGSVVVLALIVAFCIQDSGWVVPWLVLADGIAGILLLAISCLSVFVIARLGAASLLHGSVSFAGLQRVATLAKICVLVLLVVFVGYTIPLFEEAIPLWMNQSAWREQGDYTVVASSQFSSEDLQGTSSGDASFEQKYIELYRPLNDTYHGLWATSTDYPEGTDFTEPTAAGYQTLTVNPNYLAVYPLYSVSGEQIKVAENEATPVVLIPEKLQAVQSQIRQNVAAYYSGMGKAEASKYGSDSHNYGGIVASDIRFIVYRDDAGLFSYDTNVAQNNNYELISPVVYVMTDANASRMQLGDLIKSGPNYPMKLPLNAEQRERLQKELSEGDLANNHLRLSLLEDAFLNEVGQSQLSFTLLVAACGVVLMVSGLASALLVHLAILSQGDKLAVEMLLGWSFFERHRSTLARELIALVLIVSLVGINTRSVLGVGFTACAFAIDVAVGALIYLVYERQNAAVLVKGGGYLGE